MEVAKAFGKAKVICRCGSKNIVQQAEGIYNCRFLCIDCGFECVAKVDECDNIQWEYIHGAAFLKQTGEEGSVR